MTSLLAWFASDKKAAGQFMPASVYIASDSRITWGDSPYLWDAGKKVFASATHPDIFGYWGDSLFAALVLGQVVGAIDGGYLFSNTDPVGRKFAKVTQLIRSAWEKYPTEQKRSTHIVHASREGSGVGCQFWLQAHSFKRESVKSESPVVAPSGEPSHAMLAGGSGRESINDHLQDWNNRYSNRHTSRAVFAAFCESIRSNHDPKSGGPPQLVGLYRIGAGKSFGVIWNSARYFEGLPTVAIAEKASVDWRNDSFEIVDFKTKVRMASAAKHPRIIDFGTSQC